MLPPADILAEGIAACPEDIDLVEIHGDGFPRRRGGPTFRSPGQARSSRPGPGRGICR